MRLNDLKYELMVLNQNLGTVVPTSGLANEIIAKSNELQAEIVRLEKELSVKPVEVKSEAEQSVKKFQDEEGHVRIWSSSSDS